MLISYVLYPFAAAKYHMRFGIKPQQEVDVGIFGHKLYTANVQDLQTIRTLSKKSAQPVYFFLTKTIDTHRMGINIEDLCQILQGYFLGLTGQSVRIEVISYTDIVLFYPIFNEYYVYCHDAEFVFQRNLEEFVNRCYLSSSWLALLREKEHPTFVDVRSDALDRIHQIGVVTYDANMQLYVAQDTIAKYVSELEDNVEWISERGIVRSSLKSEESKILIELSEVWKLNRAVTPAGVFVYESETLSFIETYTVNPNNIQSYVADLTLLSKIEPAEILTGFPFNFWVKESVFRILLGLTPLARLFIKKDSIEELKRDMIGKNPLLSALPFIFVETGQEMGFYYIPVLNPADLQEDQNVNNEDQNVNDEEITPWGRQLMQTAGVTSAASVSPEIPNIRT